MSTRKKLPTNKKLNQKIMVSKKSLRSSPTTFLSLLPQNQYYQDHRQETKRQEQEAIMATKKKNERLDDGKQLLKLIQEDERKRIKKIEDHIIDAEKFRLDMQTKSEINSDDEDDEIIGFHTWKTIEEKPKPIIKSPTMFSLNKLGGQKRTSGRKNGKRRKTKKILYKTKSKAIRNSCITYKK